MQSLKRALEDVSCTSHKAQNHERTACSIGLQLGVGKLGQAPECLQSHIWT